MSLFSKSNLPSRLHITSNEITNSSPLWFDLLCLQGCILGKHSYIGMRDLAKFLEVQSLTKTWKISGKEKT